MPHIGYKQSSEHRAKTSQCSTGSNNGMYGKKHSEETKRKQALKRIGKIPWNKGLTKETDERVLKYSISGSKTQKGRPLTEKQIAGLIKRNKKDSYQPSKMATELLNSIEQSECMLIEREFPLYDDKYGLKFYDGKVQGNNVLIEIDSAYWHSTPKQKANDIIKEEIAKNQGFELLRIAIC